ncbi:mucin-associated surface protein [Arthrobacter pascens]|uniref:mucin-associated surface protein n=1 Tax=Arthrobacter pascens TaxID=1677 RepID=UPI00196AB297|nr:mucin-associated surface protein [Arthrobacter pascens]MBN3497269.1 mucin-associated surface protein [Arthrobacter pascens]
MKDLLDRRGRRLHVAARLAAACLTVAALSGCAAAPGDLDPQTGRELQARVLAVSTAAANADPAVGLRTLDELVDHLTRAAADGDVSFKRHQSIMKAIGAVRADLRAAMAAKTAASKAAAEKAAAAAEKAAAAAEKVAAEATETAAAPNIAVRPAPATLAPLPLPSPAPDNGNGGKGPGDSPGNGSGKGKGKTEG